MYMDDKYTTNVVVLGAGVSGLTTALLLARNPAFSITIIAKHMPGDYSIDYASPWAGANFQPMSYPLACRWEEGSWTELSRLAAFVPEAGIHHQRSRIYRRHEEMNGSGLSFDAMFSLDPWYSRMFSDFRELDPQDLPEGQGIHSGCEFTGICINTSIYLAWLVGSCRKAGVVLRRGEVSHISDLQGMHHSGKPAAVIVNASGLGSKTLGGVNDCSMVPIRGQTVLVENEASPMYNISGTADGPEQISYLMTRAAGGGTILGGTYEKGKTDENPDPKVSEKIINRAIKLCPSLLGGKGRDAIKVIRSGVGLRPWRRGGVRVEVDPNMTDGGSVIVHNYGHAGWGYQGSYGCAQRVVELVTEVVKSGRETSRLSAKL